MPWAVRHEASRFVRSAKSANDFALKSPGAQALMTSNGFSAMAGADMGMDRHGR